MATQSPNRPAAHVAPITCFRDQLEYLERIGQLVRVKKPVSPEFEVAAVAKRLDPGPAIFFEKVTGYDMPIALGTDGDRTRIAASLGVQPIGLIDHYVNAINNPIAPEIVPTGPIKEVVRIGNIDLMADLPIMTHYERDGGPYLTTGIIFAADPNRGILNLSYHRMQVRDNDTFRALIVPRHLRLMLEEAEAQGRPLPIAIVLGMDSAQRLAAATWGSTIPINLSEVAISGALKGRPERLVKCETCDVHVPADAEIVLEGEILPGQREEEGPFAEYTGNYGRIAMSPIIRIKAITRRKDAICQGLLAFTSEHHNLLGLPFEPVLLKVLRGILPFTQGVHITAGGCGKFHVIVGIQKRHEGDGKDAILAALYAVRDIKQVTVVDDDIDIFNMKDVEWAVATRVQADKDLVIISGAKGNELDPSTHGTSVTAKMGIDATKPLADARQFEKAVVPGAADLNLDEYLR